MKNIGLLDFTRRTKTSIIKVGVWIGVFWVVCCTDLVLGSDEFWPSFRGPRYNGSSGTSGLPVAISKRNHIKWKINLPGQGSSTPIVWDNYAFITSENSERTEVIATQVNIWTGQISWSHSYSKAKTTDRRSDMAASTPTTNGKQVVFMSGNGDIVAFDFTGKQLWRRNLQEDFGTISLKWSYSSSPVLFEDQLFIQLLHQSEKSYLVSIDPESGDYLWEHERIHRAKGEAMDAYSSPVPIIHRDRKEVLVLGADCITGHHPENGSELWRWGTWNRERVLDWRMVSSPVFGNNGIIALCAPKGGAVYTLKAGAKGPVNIAKTNWVGKVNELSCDITTPLFYNDWFFFLNGRAKVLTCLDPLTGDVKWSEQLPARTKIEASPTGADGRVHIISHTGEVFIVAADKKYELLHSSVLGYDLNGRNRSSIVPARGMLFIRVGNQLWCMD